MSEREYHEREFAEHANRAYLGPLLSPLELHDGATFADLGCGSGYVNAFCTSQYHLRHNVGLEFNFDTLRLAREKNVTTACVHWICGSAEAIPLPAASVDALVCRVVIPLVGVNQVIAEIGRILKPGGNALLGLHDWKFYMRWISMNPRAWKNSIAALLHLSLGGWFNLTGHQFRPRYRGHVIGQTFQSNFRMKRLLRTHGMSIKSVIAEPEYRLYAQRVSAD